MGLETLGHLWLSGPPGRMSPWNQALALAMREASKEVHNGIVNLPWIAKRVTKANGESPGRSALHQFFALVDKDPSWYPGKHSGAKRGPAPLMTAAKRRCIALSAMAIKKRGEEPTVEEVVRRCPAATANPQTGEMFAPKTIRKVFLKDCYDFDPGQPWKYQHTLQKVFLPEDVQLLRLRMAKHIQAMNLRGSWWYNNVVWMDPCASVLPGSKLQYEKMKQALKGNRRYISDDAKMYSRNLQGPPTALKQLTWQGKKVNWCIVLTRGRVHVEVLPADWSLDGAGMAVVVSRLPKALRKMLSRGARAPRILFTDRGTGMYAPCGSPVREYADAVATHGFRLFWAAGESARQSPDMPDVLLHETAVAIFRAHMRKTMPEVLPWKETREQWSVRARKVVKQMNKECDLRGLCLEMPSRLQLLIDKHGDRLRK